MTLRRALSELVHEGSLFREQGRGSFVVKTRLQERLRHLTSFTEEMRLQGLPTTFRILAFQVVTDETVAHKLDVPPEEELVRLQGIWLAGGEAVALQTAFVRHRFCPGLAERGLVGAILLGAPDLVAQVEAWIQDRAHAEGEIDRLLARPNGSPS